VPNKGEQAQGAEDDSPLIEPPKVLTPEAAVARVNEYQDSVELHKDFLDKLVSVPWGKGQTRMVTVAEAIKGHMRQNDSTRNWQQLQQERTAFDSDKKSYQQHFSEIKDPTKLLEVYERNGYDMRQVAVLIAQREAADNRIIQAAGIAEMQRIGVQDPNDSRVVDAMRQAQQHLRGQRDQDVRMRQIESENRRLQAGQKENAHKQDVAQLQDTIKRSLDQLVPPVFKAVGLRDTQQNRMRHIKVMRDIMTMTGAREVTRDVVMDAAQAVRQDIDDERSANAPPPGNQPVGPNRLGTGDGPMRVPGGNQQPQRISQMRKTLSR
jgi:hypothetical protein